MITSANDEIVNKMISACQALQAALQTDQYNCETQNFLSMKESNKDISNLLYQLNTLANQYTSQSDDLTANIQELREEVAKCYEFILINSRIIFSNLNHLRGALDKVVAANNPPSYVYNNKGKL